MIKLIFCLAFVSMVIGEEYPGFVKAVGKGREYFISKEQIIFGQAFASCKINSWTLARELKAEDTKIINEALVNSKRAEKDYWIGGYLYDNNKKPEWIWYDGGEVMKYTNFVGGKVPTDDSKKRCLVKTTEGAVSGKWKPADCVEKHHYICLQ